MNHEVASFVSMGLLKCIQRFEEGKANGAEYVSYYKSYVAHWKKHAHLAIIMARKSASLLIHSFVPSLCKPEGDSKPEAPYGKPEATCGKPEDDCKSEKLL
jgi:hypothetical protein